MPALHALLAAWHFVVVQEAAGMLELTEKFLAARIMADQVLVSVSACVPVAGNVPQSTTISPRARAIAFSRRRVRCKLPPTTRTTSTCAKLDVRQFSITFHSRFQSRC